MVNAISVKKKPTKDIKPVMKQQKTSNLALSLHHFQKVKPHFYKLYNAIYTKKLQINVTFIPENTVDGKQTGNVQ